MLMRVERFALRIKPLDAVLAEHRDQLSLDHRDSLDEALERHVLLDQSVRYGVECPLHVIADAYDVAGKFDDCELGLIRFFTFQPFSNIVHFGMRTEHAIFQVGYLGFQPSHLVGVA